MASDTLLRTYIVNREFQSDRYDNSPDACVEEVRYLLALAVAKNSWWVPVLQTESLVNNTTVISMRVTLIPDGSWAKLHKFLLEHLSVNAYEEFNRMVLQKEL